MALSLFFSLLKMYRLIFPLGSAVPFPDELCHVCLNEGMALCSLKKNEKLSSGEIGALLGLTNSNTSKVIKSIEDKGYVTRVIGDKDKRQMYFSLTAKGFELISSVKCDGVEIPELLNGIL